VSALPDLPDPKDPPNDDPKTPPAKGGSDGGRTASDGSSTCATKSCDKVTLGQDKASFQLILIEKANAIRSAVTEQIAAATSPNGAYVAPKDCPKDQGVNFVLPAISVVLPQALDVK
jgi:hypothetical protein